MSPRRSETRPVNSADNCDTPPLGNSTDGKRIPEASLNLPRKRLPLVCCTVLGIAEIGRFLRRNAVFVPSSDGTKRTHHRLERADGLDGDSSRWVARGFIRTSRISSRPHQGRPNPGCCPADSPAYRLENQDLGLYGQAGFGAPHFPGSAQDWRCQSGEPASDGTRWTFPARSKRAVRDTRLFVSQSLVNLVLVQYKQFDAR